MKNITPSHCVKSLRNKRQWWWMGDGGAQWYDISDSFQEGISVNKNELLISSLACGYFVFLYSPVVAWLDFLFFLLHDITLK